MFVFNTLINTHITAGFLVNAIRFCITKIIYKHLKPQ